MRLSWAILTTQAIILMLAGISIGLEAFAFINDLNWNKIISSRDRRLLPFKKFTKCKLYYSNGSVITPDQGMYNKVFAAKKRDLPYELPFLALMSFSFIKYLALMIVYVLWKKILPNIYICIVSNVLGAGVHSASFFLLLYSTLIYTDKSQNYMGHEFCYQFNCQNCPENMDDYFERSKSLHEESRACLEKLHICQATGFKDRTVYLVFGCLICSCVGLRSSIMRLCRHLRRAKIRPNKSFPRKDIDDSSSSYSVPPPSMEHMLKNSSTAKDNSRLNALSSETLL